MTRENTVRSLGAATLVSLGVVAPTLRRGGVLDAAEGRAGKRPGPREHDSAAAAQPRRDLRAELAGRVHFRSERWEIEPVDAAILDEKISFLKAAPEACLRIIGHSDERGGEIYNLALGRRRAVAAQAYLVTHGVDASRIEAVSAGEGQPLDLRHTETAWAENRRDEFKLLDGRGTPGTEAGDPTTCPRAASAPRAPPW